MDANNFSLVYIIGTYPSLTTTFIDREIQAMREQGVPVHVISIRRPPPLLSNAQKELQAITSYLLPLSRAMFIFAHLHFMLKTPLLYLGTLLKLVASSHPNLAAHVRTILHFAEGVYAAKIISRQPCSHIHAHFADRAATVAFVASRLLNIPYSLTAHANDIYVKPVLLPHKLLQAKFVSTCTDYNHRYLDGLVPLNGRLHCVYHGLDMQSYQPVQSQAEIPLITSVGQLKEKKGLRYLLDSCAMLKSKGYAFHCQIIGEGPLRPELEQQIQDLALEEHVTMRGALPHESVIREYQRSTIFVLPCLTGSDGDRDGIPNVILEALAMQLPVISTRHSGIPEVVTDGVNGLLVPPGDAQSLADAIALLLEDPILRSRLGRCGREVVTERFDIRRNTARLLEEMVKI